MIGWITIQPLINSGYLLPLASSLVKDDKSTTSN
jgi:hypothetical protein